MAKRVYKNPFNGEKFKTASACYVNIESNHCKQLDSLGVTAAQLVFNANNKYPLNRKHGKSVISGKPTEWNEKAKRYERFSNDKEREEYREMFIARMQKKHGKKHLLNDPDMQKKMLANRSISGTYKFINNKEVVYTGTYEHDFLQLMDLTLNWNPSDIHMPSPKVFEYKDKDGKVRFYIPDAWIESLNMYIEIKASDNNHYRKRDIDIEHIKDDVMKTSSNYYYKIEDMKYGGFLDYITAVINEEI